MSIGTFDQKDHPPKPSEIAAALGPAVELWNKLVQWMREIFSAQQELKYMYGRKYGWAFRFQIKGRLFGALYPTQNGLTAQVILNRACLRQAALLKLGKSAKQAMQRANLYAEGKWLFIPVRCERDADDVKRLLSLKTEAVTKQDKELQTSASRE